MKAPDNILPFPQAEQVEQRAAEWAVRMEDGLSDEETAAFRSWYAASVRHREAFARLSHLLQHCDLLAELTDHAAADVTCASRADGAAPRPALRYLSGGRAFLAAGLTSIALLAASPLQERNLVPHPATARDVHELVAETTVGERRTLTLPDGSSVELNTASRVTIRYEAAARIVQLTRGEAHFIVASDPQRPFSVHAAGQVITAVGTAFTVQMRRDALEVTVAEGRVTLADVGAGAATASPEADLAFPALEAGQSAMVREGQRYLAALAPAELERKLAWRRGMLSFAGEPMLQVLEEIARYTDIVIEVTDPSLRDLPIAGRLRIDDVESMLQALQLMADVRLERLSDRHVRLRPRSKV